MSQELERIEHLFKPHFTIEPDFYCKEQFHPHILEEVRNHFLNERQSSKVEQKAVDMDLFIKRNPIPLKLLRLNPTK